MSNDELIELAHLLMREHNHLETPKGKDLKHAKRLDFLQEKYRRKWPHGPIEGSFGG